MGGDVGTATRSGGPQYARLKDLTGSGTELQATFQTMASLLESADFNASVTFRIREDQTFRSFTVSVADGTGKAAAEADPNADLEVITSAETWSEVASGSLSPLDAFVGGRLRMRGDLPVGVSMLTHLAGTSGRVQIC
jgi:putative sterol carrier protein